MAPAVSLTPATLPPPAPAPTDLSPINRWLESFNQLAVAGTKPSVETISSLFLDNSYWRDHLCLSWDYNTAHGPTNIHSLLTTSTSTSTSYSSPSIPTLTISSQPFVAPIDFEATINAINAFVSVKTSVGQGRGFVSLLQDKADGNKWKAFNVFTALYGLEKFPERVDANRPHGVTHGAHLGRMNWKDRRAAEMKENNPVVVIVGAGQGGLVTAARLKMLGIETLVVEKNERVGDNWRKRYHQLVLHDPVYYDHLPYLPFPPTWPIFTPKDKLADWFETYASALELNILTSATLTSTNYNPTTQTWSLTVSTPSPTTASTTTTTATTRTLTCRHLVLATGHSGEPNFPSQIPGLSTFPGLLCHSSSFPGASDHTTTQQNQKQKQKKAVVVGCCNSAHDIAQDYYEHGYSVTLVQRSSTYVMSSEHGLSVLFTGLYDSSPTCPPTDDADLLFMSIPIAVLKRNQISVTKEIASPHRDGPALKGLESKGFKLDVGPHGSGFFMKYLERGGGYYLDVGCSKLIADGKIAVHQGREIKEVTPQGLTFEDGSKLEADEIVFATGYKNMVTTAARILGEEAVEGVEDVWGVDGETGEIRGMWKPQGRDGRLWFMGGNLALTRWFSRGVALGIAAREAGLVDGVVDALAKGVAGAKL